MSSPTSKRPPARRKSHPTKKSKWEHPPPTPLHDPNESCFPKNRTHEGYMKYYDYKTSLTNYYFVLSNNFLLAARSIDSTKLSIVIPVEGKIIVIDDCGDDDDEDMVSGKKEDEDMVGDGRKFIIRGKRKTFHFETSSREETLKWMDVIAKACRLKVTDVYRLCYEIGSGSCGTSVLAAEHRSTRKRVAIKVINKKKIKNRQRLSHEITIMKKLRHQPCIVELYDIYESKKHLYLVMELCEGGDLLTTVANQKHFEDITCHVMHQIARAVNHMHKKGIVHRDLKPENILCCKKGSVERIKVADFGISKHMNLLQQQFSTPVGTLTYTAPELLNGELYGKEVDYWALGVIMHIMLCGYSPWSHCNSEIETKRCIVDQDVELKDEDWMHVSQKVKDLVLRLLHRNPKKRATNDEILTITWEENKQQTSYKNARSKLKKTIRGDRARQCSTGTVEANIHLMKRVYNSNKYQNNNKKKKKQQPKIKHNDDYKEERYLSPPPPKYKNKKQSHHRRHNKKNKKYSTTRTSSNLSQSSTSATDEESDNFPSTNQDTLKIVEQNNNNNYYNNNKGKRRKKSHHSSEPLNRKDYNSMVKYPNHEYRRRSRDDSEICNERLRLAQRSIERYIEKKNREKQNLDTDTDADSDAFPHIEAYKLMSLRLFDV